MTALYARLAGQDRRDLEIRLLSGSATLPERGINTQYVGCGLGQSRSNFPEAVRDRTAVVRRGGNTFKEKAKLAEAAGAAAVIIYNNGPGNFFGTLGEQTPENPHPRIPVVSLSKEDGEFLLGREKDEKGVYTQMLLLDPTPVPQPDRLAEFSSRGPTRDNRIKPDLTAPGVDIFSATILPSMAPPLPGIGNMADPSAYTSTSGTSMATPHIAGACALLKQAHPDWDSFAIKAALVNTARWMDGQGGTMDQGAGRVDLVKAIEAKGALVTAASPPEPTCSFGIVAHAGKRTSVKGEFRVLDLGGEGSSACRVRVDWLKRAPGMRAYLSARQLAVPQNCHAGFGVEIRINGQNVPDDTYFGLIVVTADWGVMRLPFMIATRGQGPSVPPAPEPVAPPGPQQPGPRIPAPAPRPSARCPA